ncbi:MAG TPA: DUF998 domain-containing protein [Ktedonobacterales bacterium]|nr:DUF998 domain-containing protein [Ktedonobacterales bacterium]
MTPTTAQARPASAGPGTRMTRLLLTGGMVGPVLFLIVLLIEGATRPGYSAWRQFGSELSLSSQGWEQVANFLMCGVLCLGFAVGLRRALGGGRGAIAGPVALAVFGTALLVAGIFKTDPGLGYPPGVPTPSSPTPHGAVHALAGLFVFVSLTVACIALARRFAGNARWRGWALYSVVTGVIVLLSLVFCNVAANQIIDGTQPNAPAGLLQRVGIVAGWVWIALLATRLLRMTRPAAA